MRRIIGHMVTRNELDRYLNQTLAWLQDELVDDVVVYDDQSDDGTWEYLEAQDVQAARRPDHVPSFLDDESRFRHAAWQAMEAAAHPIEGDWILCVDADEFLVTEDGERVADELDDTLSHCRSAGRLAVNFNVREVFGFDDDTFLVRKDAYWGGITACRLVRWRPGATFEACPQGGGSVPNAWSDWRFIARNLSLLHLGYARVEDRQTKYDRYIGGRGHNPTHIASILRPGRLVAWTGTEPVRRTSRSS